MRWFGWTHHCQSKLLERQQWLEPTPQLMKEKRKLKQALSRKKLNACWWTSHTHYPPVREKCNSLELHAKRTKGTNLELCFLRSLKKKTLEVTGTTIFKLLTGTLSGQLPKACTHQYNWLEVVKESQTVNVDNLMNQHTRDFQPSLVDPKKR